MDKQIEDFEYQISLLGSELNLNFNTLYAFHKRLEYSELHQGQHFFPKHGRVMALCGYDLPLCL